MKTDDLKAFDAVIRIGSISDAARALGLTQPTITRRIQNLEEDLGVQLLDRNTKPPRPSALGVRVHEQTRTVLRELEMLRDLVSTDAAPAGKLRVGLTHSMGTAGLIDVLSVMKESFPDVHIELSTDWSSGLLDRVAAGRLDAATVFLPGNVAHADGIEERRLASTEVVVVAKKGQFAKTAGALRHFSETGWVLNPEGCGFRAGLLRALNEAGLPFRLNLETYGTELQLGLVGAGLGLGLVSMPSLKAYAGVDGLDVLTLRDFKFAVDVCLVHPRFQGNLGAAVEHFGDLVSEAFRSRLSGKPLKRRSA
jgi:DNA-binding transcriptional LysR family regulator